MQSEPSRRPSHSYMFLPPLVILPSFAGLLCLLLLLLFTPAAAKDTPNGPEALGSIAGVVTAPGDQPLAGIVVSLLNTFGASPRYQLTTTTTGRFHFPALLPGVYRLQAEDQTGLFATQYFTATNDFDHATDIVVNGGPVTNLKFLLQPAGRIIGKITLAGAVPQVSPNVTNYLSFYGQDSNKVLGSTPIISETGVYTIAALLPAVYRICATIYLPVNSRYISACYGGSDFQRAASVTVTGGVTLTNIDFDIEQAQFEGAINGKVTLKGIPLGNIRVDLQGGDFGINVYTMTNQGGYYSFRGLPSGLYGALFSDPANRYPRLWHDSRPAGPELPALSHQQPISLQSGQVLSNLDIAMLEYGSIQGKVYRYSSLLQAGEQITVLLNYLSTDSTFTVARYPRVDAQGRYTITRLFPGVYTIAFPHCQAYPNMTVCFNRYYGEDDNSTNSAGTPVKVDSGGLVTGIDSIIGRDPILYLPLIQAAEK
jgi:hypothetical protein